MCFFFIISKRATQRLGGLPENPEDECMADKSLVLRTVVRSQVPSKHQERFVSLAGLLHEIPMFKEFMLA